MKSPDKFIWCLSLLIPLLGFSQSNEPEPNIGFLDFCWSPDSKTIYFSYMEVKKDWSDYNPNKWKIGKSSIEGGSVETIVEQALHVAVSPHNKFLSFVSERSGNAELYLLNLKSRKTKQLTQTPDKEGAACWSPDGKWIAYNKGDKENLQIYVMDKNGKNQRPLTPENYKAYTPDWSPDGKQICYYSEKGDSKDQIHVMDADGKNDRNITQDTLLNFYPGWTKEGQLIYTNAKKDGITQLLLVNVDGTQKKEILNNINAFFIRQSPDGEKIAFIGNRKNPGIFITDLDGRNVRPIVTAASFFKKQP